LACRLAGRAAVDAVFGFAASANDVNSRGVWPDRFFSAMLR
jgi:hypothetical protein